MTAATEIPYGLCHCGCGEATQLAQRTSSRDGIRKGEPQKYLAQHHRRKTPDEYQINASTGCWEWTRAINSEGYGNATVDGRTVRAHRMVYEREVSQIPDGLDLDHLCRNRRCVNPEHLEPVSRAENIRRGSGAVLTLEAAQQIRALVEQGASKAEVAAEHGVGITTLYPLLANETWVQ